MNNDLAPSHQRLFGQHWVLWYPKSNNYSVVEPEFKILLDYYLQSNSFNQFVSKLALLDMASDVEAISKSLKTYLQNCNLTQNLPVTDAEFSKSYRKILKQYSIKNKDIQIYFDSPLVEKTIHPPLAHLEVDKLDKVDITFDIYLEENQLRLFKNKELITSVPKRDYYLLQGKFIMELLCTIHNKTESDWISTFHGSTVADGHSSILFIGKSGKGKSTLCTLLASNGFELVADDVSPMLSKDKMIYHNPSAISMKEGAFDLLKPIVNRFDELPITQFNTNKGPLKYIPFSKPKNANYPCKAIVMVNYKNGAETDLEPILVKTILETVIPDSWLSPNPLHSKQFLDWLETVDLYQLTYSDTNSVIKKLSGLFKKLENQ